MGRQVGLVAAPLLVLVAAIVHDQAAIGAEHELGLGVVVNVADGQAGNAFVFIRRVAPQQRVVLRVEVIHAAVVGIGDDLVELVVVNVEDKHAGHGPFEIVAVPHPGIGLVALFIDVEPAGRRGRRARGGLGLHPQSGAGYCRIRLGRRYKPAIPQLAPC